MHLCGAALKRPHDAAHLCVFQFGDAQPRVSAVNTMPPPQTKRPSMVVEEAPSASSLELTRFALSAARRHWLLGLTVMLISGALGVLIVSVIPPTYESNAKIFDTQSGAITASVAGGKRAEERTMRGLQETVLNRENVLSIVRESKLVERWQASRSWPLQIKDALLVWAFGEPKPEDLERGMVGMLEERAITVAAEEGSSIRFRVQLRDPRLARDIADLVQRNFLEARRKSEFEAITRGIALLEDESKRADEAIEPAIKEMQQMLVKARQKKIDAATKPAPADKAVETGQKGARGAARAARPGSSRSRRVRHRPRSPSGSTRSDVRSAT